MPTQPIHEKWFDRVAYDMDTAKAMLDAGKLIYAIFMCQQSLEKRLKALLAYQQKDVVPVHNLRRLAEFAEVVQEWNEPTLLKLDFLSSYYINARYKEDLQTLSRGITESTAKDFIQFSEEMIGWLCQKMR